MNGATLLLRQIHPSFLQQGMPSSQAFRPTPKDERQLSVYDGDQITPAGAYAHYTQTLAQSSSGVMAVTADECITLELWVRPDPTPFREHALIFFSAFSNGQAEDKAKLLKAKAIARGWLHP